MDMTIQEQKEDPFSLENVERREDIWVVTYYCPRGCSFDIFVAFNNLGRVGVTPCFNHPELVAWIHNSRPIR